MEKTQKKTTTQDQAIKKLEHYCAYQDRCHTEIYSKLFSLGVPTEYHDDVIVHLIKENFLNEERFARSFARGKHRINYWGKTRIINELKYRKISEYNIKKALEELPDELYFETFDKISLNKWNSTKTDSLKTKKNKVISFLHRKGYESEYIYEKIHYLSENNK